MDPELTELLEVARHAATVAGEIVMPLYGQRLAVELKEDGTPVTEADRRAEEAMRALFARETPGFGVVGEELGESPGDGRNRWIIDPIDGTKSFIHHVPLFGTLVALERAGTAVIGLVACHAVGETAWAARGGGAFLNGERTYVSATAALAEATVLTTSPASLQTRSPRGFARLAREAGLLRSWGDCYGYLAVIAGRAEAMIDPVVNPWDIAPFAVLLEEAGGGLPHGRGSGEQGTTQSRPTAPSTGRCWKRWAEGSAAAVSRQQPPSGRARGLARRPGQRQQRIHRYRKGGRG